jgi:hypothetical protein
LASESCQQLPRTPRLLIGHVSLAADDQQQRVDAGRVHGMHRMDPGHFLGNHRAHQLVDQLAEERIFLRRAADHGERPERPRAVVDVLDPHHGKIVGQTVVAQVVAKWALGQFVLGFEVAGEAEVGLGVDRQLIGAADHGHAAVVQEAGEGQFAHALGHGHHGGHHHCRRPAHEDVQPQLLLAAQRGGVVDAQSAMDLVVQPDLAVGLVLSAGDLHAVHAQVGMGQSGAIGVFGIDLRQGDVGPAVLGPALQVRELIDRGFLLQHRPVADLLRPGVPRPPGRPQVEPRVAKCIGGIGVQLDHPAQRLQRVAEQVPHAVHGAEEVADHGETAALDAGEVDHRPARLENAALDLGRLQVGVDRLLDADHLPLGFEVFDALAERTVSHGVDSVQATGNRPVMPVHGGPAAAKAALSHPTPSRSARLL